MPSKSTKWLALLLLPLILNTTYIAGSTRAKYSQRLSSECKVTLGWIIKRMGKCTHQVRTYACRGTCMSTVKWHVNRKEYASSCSCCAPILTRRRVIHRKCQGKEVRFSFEVAKRCACRPCMFD